MFPRGWFSTTGNPSAQNTLPRHVTGQVLHLLGSHPEQSLDCDWWERVCENVPTVSALRWDHWACVPHRLPASLWVELQLAPVAAGLITYPSYPSRLPSLPCLASQFFFFFFTISILYLSIIFKANNKSTFQEWKLAIRKDYLQHLLQLQKQEFPCNSSSLLFTLITVNVAILICLRLV